MLMTTCCGTERDTHYCPDCGKKLISDPILELLDHVDKTAGAVRIQYESWMERLHNGTEVQRENARINPKKLETVKKWEAWRDALQDALAPLVERGGGQ